MTRVSAALLVLIAALSVAAPGHAQVAPPAETPAATPAPGQAEFEATAEAFGAKIEAMQQEMQTAVADPGGNAATRAAALDAIEARYQPEADAFASALETFLNQQMAAVPETERPGMLAGLAEALPQIRSVPRLVRTQVEQAAQAAPTAP